MSDDGDPRPQQELEERTVDALRHAIALGLPEDEARLLCYQSGVSFKYVAHTHTQEPR
jgi:hypothetical protein